MVAITAAGLLLARTCQPEFGTSWGPVAILGACFAWGIKNTSTFIQAYLSAFVCSENLDNQLFLLGQICPSAMMHKRKGFLFFRVKR